MKFEVPQLPPASWSPNARVHWAIRHRDGQVYQQSVFYSCVDTRNKLQRVRWRPGFPPFAKARLNLTFVFATNRKRDSDNLLSRFKSGQDALIQSGLIIDDDIKHLAIGEVKIEVDKNRAPMTIIELEEA